MVNLRLANLIKIFAKEIHEGKWDKNNVPSDILEDVREEVKKLEEEEEIEDE